MTDEELQALLDETETKTNEALAGSVGRLAKLTDAELQALIPPGIDQEAMNKLIEIVQAATRSNVQKAQAIKSIAGLTDLALKLAKKVAAA